MQMFMWYLEGIGLTLTELSETFEQVGVSLLHTGFSVIWMFGLPSTHVAHTRALTRLKAVSSPCPVRGSGLDIDTFKATRNPKVTGTLGIQSLWWQKHMLCSGFMTKLCILHITCFCQSVPPQYSSRTLLKQPLFSLSSQQAASPLCADFRSSDVSVNKR